MASPADRQAEAQEDLKRIEREFHLAHERIHGDIVEFDAGPVLAELLHRDVIRVGQRPHVEQPMTGQISIDDTDHLTEADKAAGADGK